MRMIVTAALTVLVLCSGWVLAGERPGVYPVIHKTVLWRDASTYQEVMAAAKLKDKDRAVQLVKEGRALIVGPGDKVFLAEESSQSQNLVWVYVKGHPGRWLAYILDLGPREQE